jgi:hypothetical protein
MKLTLLRLPSLVLLFVITATSIRPQQSSFTVARIRPFDKAVPGQVMEVLIEGLSSGPAPVVLPETDFKIDVSQDGVSQPAKVRIARFTMIREASAEKGAAVDFANAKMQVYQAVSFVVPKGLHPGPAEVTASYKGQRGNSVAMEILEKPMAPVIGGTAVISPGTPPERTDLKIVGNDVGWRLERGTTTQVYVNPLVDPDDPNAAVLISFKQDGNDYEAVTRIKTDASRTENRSRGVGFFPAREYLEVDIPAALTLGKAQVEIRIKANGQVSDPVNLTATITDVTRAAEVPAVSAPRVLAVIPKRVGAGQAVFISIDHRRVLEPSPKQTQVIIEQENNRYFATIEQNSAVFGPKEPEAPVGLFVRTTRQIIGRAQIRVLNPLRGEQTGLSAPVSVEIVDEVFSPELTSAGEATDSDLARLREMYETQKQAGRKFPEYDPAERYLTIRVRGIDYNPNFVRITLEQANQKFTLSPADFSSYSGETLIVRLPDGLKGGNVKLSIENSGGDRYSTPVTTSFVLR